MGPWPAIKQVITIARHSGTQAIRMRLVIVIVVFLMVLVPTLPFILQTDETHAGQIRMIITYCLYLTSFLLSVLTLFLSCMTLNTEIKHQHIFLLDPKPLSRGTLLMGKWLGVMLVNLALLAVMVGITYGLVHYFAQPWPRPDESLDEYKPYSLLRFLGYKWPPRPETEKGYRLLKAQLLTARKKVLPRLPDLEGWVDREVENLKKKKLMPAHKSEEWVRERLRDRFSRSAWRVPPGGTQKWIVSGVPKFDGLLLIRFRHYAEGGPHNHDIRGQFKINESGQPMADTGITTFRAGKLHTFGVPAGVVRDDGTVEIRYSNYDRQGVAALFPFEDGLQVMYPAAGLGQNFIRVGSLIFLRLAFIAIVGIFASTFLSFPVALLFSLVVFMVGHLADFIFTDLIRDLYIFGTSLVPPGTPLNPFDLVIRRILYYFFSVFPNFGPYDGVPIIAEGLLVETNRILGCLLWLPLIRGGVLALVGWYIFHRRELAALTPST